jgi:Ulp1 family protease
MEANTRTYSKEFNKRIRLERSKNNGRLLKEDEKLDPLKFMRRLGSDDEKDDNLDDENDDEVDEIIANPVKRNEFSSVIQPKKKCNGSSSGSSSSSFSRLKKEIEISDDEGDVISTGSSPASFQNNNTPKSTQSPTSSRALCNNEAFAIDIKSYRTLDYGSMLNDTIVHFYMNYLMKKGSIFRATGIHLFNSFFFSKFTSLYKDQLRDKKVSASTVKQIVARWDKHVKIFEKDFLVIPVCDRQHWLLLIVAFASNVPADGDEPLVVKETARNSSKCYNEPAILIFDSLGYRYLSRFTNPIRNIFLKIRWQIERPNEDPKNFEDRTLMRDISAQVPKQRNMYDCGVHLLHSFELFLENPMRVYKKVLASEDLRADFWLDATEKRAKIKSLIPKTCA